MSWERDPLLAKAKLFFERAFENSTDDAVFGLWCSLGLEMMARAAVASVSPALLAEPEREQKHLLFALGQGASRGQPKSIDATLVFALCKKLFQDFTEADLKAAVALANQRNEELHSGSSAFEQYPSTVWLAGFYRAVTSLASALEESLETILGEDEAKAASKTLEGDRNDTMQRVNGKVASYRGVFSDKPEAEREALRIAAEAAAKDTAFSGGHKVVCPACGCEASVSGLPFGKERVETKENEILVRQLVSPTRFECTACKLVLEGYADLEVVGLAGIHTRTTTYAPETYFGLIHPDDIPELVREYWEGEGGQEYDNE